MKISGAKKQDFEAIKYSIEPYQKLTVKDIKKMKHDRLLEKKRNAKILQKKWKKKPIKAGKHIDQALFTPTNELYGNYNPVIIQKDIRIKILRRKEIPKKSIFTQSLTELMSVPRYFKINKKERMLMERDNKARRRAKAKARKDSSESEI